MEMDHYYTQRDLCPSSEASVPPTSTKIPHLSDLSTLLLFDDIDDVEEDKEETTVGQTGSQSQVPPAEADAFLTMVEVTRPRARRVAGSKRVAVSRKRWNDAVASVDPTMLPVEIKPDHRGMLYLQSITASRADLGSFEELRVECYLQAAVASGFGFVASSSFHLESPSDTPPPSTSTDKPFGFITSGQRAFDDQPSKARPPYAVPPYNESTGMPQRSWSLPPFFNPVAVYAGRDDEGIKGDTVMGVSSGK